jgi:hypothetical protein
VVRVAETLRRMRMTTLSSRQEDGPSREWRRAVERLPVVFNPGDVARVREQVTQSGSAVRGIGPIPTDDPTAWSARISIAQTSPVRLLTQ